MSGVFTNRFGEKEEVHTNSYASFRRRVDMDEQLQREEIEALGYSPVRLCRKKTFAEQMGQVI